MTKYQNFGDCSVHHGQVWIANAGDSDFAPVVEINSGSDIGLADNQYQIERGSIYFSPNCWNAALDCSGIDRIGPPEFLEIAQAFHSYHGMERDIWGGFEIVQIGKKLDDWTASGTTCTEPDKVLRGNASIRKYLEREYLA